jgi:hypothetical protein
MAMNGWNGFSSLDASPGPTPTGRRGSRSKTAKQLKNAPQTPGSSAAGKYYSHELLPHFKPTTCVQNFCGIILIFFVSL